MAYDFFPKTESELRSKINKFPDQNKIDIVSLFNYLKDKYKNVATPINLDLKKPSHINVTRQLNGTIDIRQLKNKANLKKIKIKFGNGSSGNRGVNNRGNLFEPAFAQAMEQWWNGEPVVNKSMLDAIEDLDKTYKFSNQKTFKVLVEGAENTKRPLQFSNGIHISNPKGNGTDVGESVTDLTVKSGSKPVYLSLKLGGTTTFFNVGVRTILTPKEIKLGEIKNKNGLQLLNLFGIDQKLFCQIFNNELPGGKKISNAPYNKSDMRKLLESGIGHNYHIIHKMGSKILSKKMDSAAMKKAASTGNLTIHYGGKTGNGKRIDMEFQSTTYKFKLNIRDTQGKDGYPTRMMCDFKYA